MLTERYLEKIEERISSAREQLETLGAAGKVVADCIIDGGIIHTFGSGHS
ncbi:MAG: SIS domain-containing protein, partial [Halanaerobiales bacterium]